MYLRLAASIVIALYAAPTFAWNSLGHKVVAEIAWRKLDPDKRQQIVDILRRHPRFDTDFVAKMEDDVQKGGKEIQDHWIFQHAATWPDIARGIKGDEHKQYDRPTWHYINLPLYLHPVDKAVLFAKLRVNLSEQYSSWKSKDQLNVLQAIAYSRDTLASKAGPDVKAVAYCWLMHLVGDIHQPLHSTALFSVERFPDGDEGGNKIPLNRGKNLHALWDNLLGRQYYMRNVEKAVVELSKRDRYGEVWDSAAKETDPKKWADESHALCESFVYDEVIMNAVKSTPASEKLDPIELPVDYMREAGHQARLRIIAAGVRLGALLDNLSK